MRIFEQNKDVVNWFIELGGDGELDSFVFNGSFEKMIEMINKETGDDFTNEIKDEDDWSMYGYLEIKLEQAYIRITPIYRNY